jgi:hypothetical protein
VKTRDIAIPRRFTFMNLKHLSDEMLLSETKVWVGRERDSTITILHHLREVEARRLFARLFESF